VGNAPIKVRIAEIDAPESKRAFGARSKKGLSDLCYHRIAENTEVGRDRYGRIVAQVSCSGRDVASEQVRTGVAWVYERYSHTDSPLYVEQAAAMAARQGPWKDGAPVPPWE